MLSSLIVRFASLHVEFQKHCQDLFICHVRFPVIGGEDGFVESLVGKIEPGGAGIVEVGKSSLFLFNVT
jgi:hypothetical protein